MTQRSREKKANIGMQKVLNLHVLFYLVTALY